MYIFLFTFKDSISSLIFILCKNTIKDETVNLFTAVLCALTNLTVLDESHSTLIPKIAIFCELLTQCEIVQIKVCHYYPYNLYVETSRNFSPEI